MEDYFIAARVAVQDDAVERQPAPERRSDPTYPCLTLPLPTPA